MLIYPAIDLFQGKAVRLYKGDYSKMTVYSDHPEEVAAEFVRQGATHIHLVDLEGARNGTTPNLEIACRIKTQTGAFCEIGGGIRSMEVAEQYFSAGIDRIILGTAAVADSAFLKKAVDTYADRIAVGIDIKDGFVAIKGWTERSALEAMEFCRQLQDMGVSTLICTDISKDGAMQGTNHKLYRSLTEQLSLRLIASGGVSTIEDVKRLAAMNIHGAIIGKAYYTGAISLRDAIEVAK